MANRISLNPTSYHGAGAIQEVVNDKADCIWPFRREGHKCQC